MKTVSFLLHTQQPILATSLQGDPNSDVSFPYFPGSMIRGVLISRYLKRPGLQDTDDILDSQSPHFPEVKRLFFNARTTRYLNAYPADIYQKRTLPVPRCWYKDKGVEFCETKDENVYDFSKIPVDERDENLSPKLLDEKFCTVKDDEVLLYRVKRRINIHNQRDRRRGRGIEGGGAVFRYDAIDAGQTFQAVVLCNSEEDKCIIKSLLQPSDIWLGGSQSAGYGHVTIELVQNDDKDDSDDNWYEVGIGPGERIERNENLTVTLLSDTIIRNEWGQAVVEPEVLRQQLSTLLNVELEFQEDGIYTNSLVVGGFNRKWGLPLPQTLAFTAGNVFVFKNVNLELKRVRTLEEQGIGERRVDGFGRVVVNWLNENTEYQAKLPQPEARRKESVKIPESLKPKSLEIAGNIADRIVRKKLDKLLLKQVSSIEITEKDKISNNQLSRLMIVARLALSQLEFEQTKPESERKTVIELAEPIHELLRNLPSNARNQFERTKLKTGERLDEQIQNWLSFPDTWIKDSWRSDPHTKDLDFPGQPTITIAGVRNVFDSHIALEYSFRLIMAVVKKTIKEKSND